MTRARRGLPPTASSALMYAAFFASGASSLVFQAIWSRLLQHVLGSSSLAISSVVSVFMAGLGLGAYVAGKRVDRVRNPLRVYALAELAIGLSSLAVPWWLREDGPIVALNGVLRAELGAGSSGFVLARFACIVPVLIVPTFLMGATLPLLARHAVLHASSPERSSRQVGQLYAVNTLGAVLGVLLSSFVFMPRIGVHATNAVAAGVNFLLCGTVLVSQAFMARAPSVPESRGESAVEAALPTAFRWAALLAFSCSGFASLLCEVVWSRALVSVIGGSLYSFSLIVATFLLGIALGSAMASFWLRPRRTHAERWLDQESAAAVPTTPSWRAKPVWMLLALQLYIALATLVSALVVDDLSLIFAGMVEPFYDELPDHVGLVQLMMCATAGLCVLPSALGMGAVFPVALRVWTDGGRRIGQDVGVLYAGNTLGSIVGAWLPGFVLVPLLGLQATLHLGIATNLCVALGLAVLLVAQRMARRAALGVCVAVPALLLVLAVDTMSARPWLAWDVSRMTLGAFRISLARDVLDEEAWGAPDVVFHRDGLSTTVTVERWGRHYSMKNNGKVDASNGDDMPTQILVAALPLLMHPRGPKGLDVSVVGFGSGVTVGAALQFPVKSLEVVELEAATVEASRYFADVNHLRYTSPRFPYVSEPRLRVIHDDGRNHLAFTRDRYDVIVSEPSNPWLTGVADLFTLDHFRVAKRRLKPRGVYCQWVQLYEISPENVKSLYRTFAAAFPHVIVFSPGNKSSDTIMVGSDEPLSFDLARVRHSMADAQVGAELRRAQVASPQDVFARVLFADRDELMQFTQGAPLNTDDNARVELSAPRDLIGFRRFRGYLQRFFGADWPYARVAAQITGFDVGAGAADAYASQVVALLSQGRKNQAGEVLARAPEPATHPALRRASAMYTALTSDLGRPALRLPSTEHAISRDATDAARTMLGLAYGVAAAAAAQGDFASAHGALTAIEPSLRRAEGGLWDYFEGVLLHDTGDHEGAIDLLAPLAERAAPVLAEHPELLYFLARSLDADGQFAHAVRNFHAYMQAREQKAEFATERVETLTPDR